jgi:hypothetical protein
MIVHDVSAFNSPPVRLSAVTYGHFSDGDHSSYRFRLTRSTDFSRKRKNSRE